MATIRKLATQNVWGPTTTSAVLCVCTQNTEKFVENSYLCQNNKKKF